MQHQLILICSEKLLIESIVVQLFFVLWVMIASPLVKSSFEERGLVANPECSILAEFSILWIQGEKK